MRLVLAIVRVGALSRVWVLGGKARPLGGGRRDLGTTRMESTRLGNGEVAKEIFFGPFVILMVMNEH